MIEMQKAEKRLQQLLLKYKKHSSRLSELNVQKINGINWGFYRICIGVAVLTVFGLIFFVHSQDSTCLVEAHSDFSKWFREPEDCSMCIGVQQVPKVRNISGDFLEENFLRPSKPVVVSDGTRDWLANEHFSFNFFRNLYQNSTALSDSCQFFPYKTKFRSLREVFAMDDKRSRLEDGQENWYIGWSNCNDEAGKVLRQYYDVPYFLRDVSENLAMNWIFMGGSGPGAHMHVDNVHYPSWQAQIRGRKKWILAPPPECYYRCEQMEVVVEPGEIIVVDTNRWYHQTIVLEGDISITIGSEFD